jgi:adenylosuccinate synthase
VRADPTERGVWLLDRVADRLVINHHCDPKSLLARATAGLGLFPMGHQRLVDVFVGASMEAKARATFAPT